MWRKSTSLSHHRADCWSPLIAVMQQAEYTLLPNAVKCALRSPLSGWFLIAQLFWWKSCFYLRRFWWSESLQTFVCLVELNTQPVSLGLNPFADPCDEAADNSLHKAARPGLQSNALQIQCNSKHFIIMRGSSSVRNKWFAKYVPCGSGIAKLLLWAIGRHWPKCLTAQRIGKNFYVSKYDTV